MSSFRIVPWPNVQGEQMVPYVLFYVKDNSNDLLRTAMSLDHEEPVDFIRHTETEKRTYEITSDNKA